jgi:hypothetical protein
MMSAAIADWDARPLRGWKTGNCLVPSGGPSITATAVTAGV